MEDWDDLKFVLAVSRGGGLSGAARLLGVNHSTVSRRIASAEERLGVRLFDRLPTGLVVTEEGQQAVEAAQDIEGFVSKLELGIAARDKALSGELRVTAPDVLIQTHIMTILQEFAEAYPEILLSVISSNQTLNLHQREADVAIRVSDKPDESLYGRRVMGQRRAFFASEAYLARKPWITDGEPGDGVLDYVVFSMWGREIPAVVMERFPQVRVAAQFNDMSALYSAVRQGVGVSLLPCMLGSFDRTMRCLGELGRSEYRDIWVLTHSDLRHVERIRCFMRFAGRIFERDRELYMGAGE